MYIAEGGPSNLCWNLTLEQSMGGGGWLGRNRVGIGLSYRARICQRLRSPGIDSASLCSLAARYVGMSYRPAGWKSIPGLLERFKNTGSGPPGYT